MNGQDENLIDIAVFTDPLCCWSWASEPQLRQLRDMLSGQATWHYRMGGLLPSWAHFHDSVNAVSRPAQMGPVWMHAAQIAHQPICHQVWITDPPASSYPACVAVKSAQLQSEEAGERMLYALREACMTDGKNIARQEVLMAVADAVARAEPRFDLARFQQDFFGEKGMEALRADLAAVAYYRINRFPSLLVKAKGAKAVIIPGYRHCEEVLQTIVALQANEDEVKQ